MTQDGARCPQHGFWALGGNFCPQCGAGMIPTPEKRPCPSCAHEVGQHANFCRNCGLDLRPHPAEQTV